MIGIEDLRNNIRIAEDLLKRKFSEIEKITKDIEEMKEKLKELSECLKKTKSHC
jgi:recombinational DNA repair protein RecR